MKNNNVPKLSPGLCHLNLCVCFCFFALVKKRSSFCVHLMNTCLQLVEPFIQPCEQCLQPQNCRVSHISVNMAHRTKVDYFSILRKFCFIQLCQRSHINEVGGTVHRLGEMVQQDGDIGS